MTLHRLAGLTAATATILALTLPAHAQMSTRGGAGNTAMLTGNVDQIARAMQDAGFETERSTDSQGEPKLDGQIDGWMYSVYFYGCGGNSCDAIQFAAGFDEDQPMDYDAINDWNRDNRFGRAYLDEEGDPWIEFDVNLEGDGVSLSNFNETLAYWDTVIKAFVNHIGW